MPQCDQWWRNADGVATRFVTPTDIIWWAFSFQRRQRFSVANSAIVPLDDGHMCLVTYGKSDVIVDVVGYAD